MPSWFSRKTAAAPTGPPLTAEELTRLADEKRQLDSVIAVKNVLSSESDKSITAISNEVFARLKNSKTERSKELTKLHSKLSAIDLGAAFHFLYTVKGAPKPGTPASYAYAPITRASAPAPAPAPIGSAPAAAPAAAAPAAAVGSAPAPAASVQYVIQQQKQPGFQAVGPAQGFQKGAVNARGHFVRSMKGLVGNMGRIGGGHTRRNLRKRNLRTNKVTRRH